MKKNLPEVRVRKGIAYYRREAAAAFAAIRAKAEFPEARIVRYAYGYAVQTRPSGDYLGRDGRPSLEARKERERLRAGARFVSDLSDVRILSRPRSGRSPTARTPSRTTLKKVRN